MPYSQFTLEDIQLEFEITIKEEVGIFTEVPEVQYSDFLAETLKYNTPLALAIATEKAKSEAITEVPEVQYSDFLISRSPSQLSIEAPVTVLVEAKNDNLNSGLGQCMAEMVAAQMFNQAKGKDIATIYGTVTTGSLWQFMRLTDKEIEVDLDEYFLKNVGKILGILRSFVAS